MASPPSQELYSQSKPSLDEKTVQPSTVPEMGENKPGALTSQDNLDAPETPDEKNIEQQDKDGIHRGVRLAQASTQLWNTKELIVLYVL